MYDGRILSADMRNYLISHKNRGINVSGNLVFAEAEKRLSPLLHIKGSRLAVIPLPSGRESLCCEFHCADGNGQEVLVYIDTETFSEAQILLLMHTDNGVLTK